MEKFVFKTYTEYIGDQKTLSESLKYHIDNNISLCESIYRPWSKSHFELLKEARVYFDLNKLNISGIDLELFESTDIGYFDNYLGKEVPLDLPIEINFTLESKSPELNKPKRGGSKKYIVYVRNPKTGNIKKIEFGDPNLTAKVSDPKARKSFAARHRCHLKTDKLTAGYWACRINRYSHLWGGKTYPGFW
jgi:hypothetical protein